MVSRSPAKPTTLKKPAKGSAGSLAKYRSKRHFDRTPEPPPKREPSASGHDFLVQKHDATRLHYDFRLELDGVLKSWAVTKGPSLDPAVRRLAVHVEDHPLAYGSFEGTIPKGQYGGGTVMLWDRGTWEPIGDAAKSYTAGKLKFILHGEHLKGGWTLVRMHGRPEDKGRDNWLLIKERDEEARPGDDDALLTSVTQSVASSKTMNQLADPAKNPVWNSNRADGKPEPAPKTPPKKPIPKATKSKPSAIRDIPGVVRGELPDFVAPELATLVDKPPAGDHWLHEIKIDGYRAYCRREKGDIRFLTRTNLDWTERFKSLIPAIKALPSQSFALDGEVAVLDAKGNSSFGALQDALSSGDLKKLRYIVFDLPFLDGYDLREAPLIERKRALRGLLDAAPASAPVRYSDHVEASGPEMFQHACQLSLEGIISKRAELPYRSGRSGAWVKSKCVTRQEFVIGGFTRTKASGRTGIGSLLLGYHEEEELRYCGRVGTGFSVEMSRDLLKQLLPLKQSSSAFAKIASAARSGAEWVRPDLVCEIEFLSWTGDGMLRHASFQGLRQDKPAAEVTRDRAKPAADAGKAMPKKKATPAVSVPARAATSTKAHSVAGVAISHPDREVFPGTGITKEGLARYYESVADWILPEIANRPLSLLRCPAGAGGECFFQKHFATGMKSLHRVTIEEKHGAAEYLTVRDTHDLVELVQEGIIELHPWGALADDPDRPDRLIFDFDPAPDVKFAKVIEAAQTMKGMLEQLNLVSFVKTTGGKGLHVVVPFARGPGWPEVKAFTRAVAATLAKAQPRTYIDTASKAARAGKIFIDYLRNDRGSTAVAAYAVRARPMAPVSMPIAWEELKAGFRADQFTLETVPKLLASRRKDPWQDLYGSKQSLDPALQK